MLDVVGVDQRGGEGNLEKFLEKQPQFFLTYET